MTAALVVNLTPARPGTPGAGHRRAGGRAPVEHDGQESADHPVHGPHIQTDRKFERSLVTVEHGAVVDVAGAVEKDIRRGRLRGKLRNRPRVENIELARRDT